MPSTRINKAMRYLDVMSNSEFGLKDNYRNERFILENNQLLRLRLLHNARIIVVFRQNIFVEHLL